MIERYTMPEMGKIWSVENRLEKMLEVEILACEGMAEIGLIPEEAAKKIREKAAFNVERIQEIERETKHDVIAFLSNVAEYVGEEAQYIHLGMTSSDVLDTALSVQMVEAGTLIKDQMLELMETVKEKAITHKYSLMMGRTHGVHAEPITFGLKMAMWYTEIKRNLERLDAAVENIRVGKISGAVGTFANIDPRIEEYVCEKLNLNPAEVSTQVIQRDRHAEYLTTMAIIATSLDKFTTEIRNLQRTEVFEVMEEFSKGQKGSSAMPHKRNPMTSERVSGLARIIRGNCIPAFENAVLWHERDLAHSSVERIIIPDTTILLNYILSLLINIVKNLRVNTENMKDNVEKTYGLVFSQRIMLAIVKKGVARDEVYRWVQKNALRAWDEKINLKELAAQDPDISQYLTSQELNEIFDYAYHTKHVDYIFSRAKID